MKNTEITNDQSSSGSQFPMKKRKYEVFKYLPISKREKILKEKIPKEKIPKDSLGYNDLL